MIAFIKLILVLCKGREIDKHSADMRNITSLLPDNFNPSSNLLPDNYNPSSKLLPDNYNPSYKLLPDNFNPRSPT